MAKFRLDTEVKESPALGLKVYPSLFCSQPLPQQENSYQIHILHDNTENVWGKKEKSLEDKKEPESMLSAAFGSVGQ